MAVDYHWDRGVVVFEAGEVLAPEFSGGVSFLLFWFVLVLGLWEVVVDELAACEW